MAYAAKLLNPIRQSFAALNSSSKLLSPSFSRQLRSVYGEFEPLKSWRKSLESSLRCNFGRPPYKLSLLRNYIQNFSLAGRKAVGGMFGLSVIFGLICFRPHVVYAMDGQDVLLDDYHINLLGASDSENDSVSFWTSARKFLLPAFILITLLINWDNPTSLVTKIILWLLSTKPSPMSVYLYVEQLCHQFMRQKPHLYMFKTLYARKVEVQDYKLLCLARVEVGDKKLTLVGILGDWWELPSPHGMFSALRTLLRNKLSTWGRRVASYWSLSVLQW